MGLVKTQELPNGNLSLEIIYGGKEAPFGGVDNSAPPAYIDPRCFALSDGAFVVDDKLCHFALNPVTLPQLFNAVNGVQLLKIGTYYGTLTGQLNYALGYTASPFGIPATGVNYTFYLTSWNPASLAFNTDVLNITLYDSSPIDSFASLTLDCIATQSTQLTAGTGATFNATAVTGTGALTTAGIAITGGGTGYNIGDFLPVYQGSQGLIPGGNGVLQVTAIGNGGAITGVVVNNGWYGFTVAALLTTVDFTDSVCGVVVTPLVPGVGAVLTIASVFANGGINTMAITTPGTGYQVGQAIQIQQAGSSEDAWCFVDTVNGTGGITACGVNVPFEGYGYSVGAVTLGVSGFAAWGTTGVPTATKATTVNSIIGTLNGIAAFSAYATASASPDGTALVITANYTGAEWNSIQVIDTSRNMNLNLAPPYYFSAPLPTGRFLEGGQIVNVATAPRSFTTPISTATVGGVLYMANLGPMILKWSGPGSFTTSSMYQGVRTLRKFAGSLIGLGIIPQLGTLVQDSDMVFAWTAAEDLDVWAPVDTNGNVTGAGFEQLADIADFLTGLVVTQSTAFIIRSQGISYASDTGNATLPFSINHVGLGDEGEGAQISNLVCQYDQTGAFIGNSDIYQISGQISSIGAKIKSLIFASLQNPPVNGSLYSASCADLFAGGESQPIVAFCVGLTPVIPNALPTSSLFIFNTSNGTWGLISFVSTSQTVPTLHYIETLVLDAFATVNSFANSQEYNQHLPVMGVQVKQGNNLLTPVVYSLSEGVPNVNSFSNPSFVVFPQEEVAFGRDVTVDGLFVALWANVTENVIVNFYITVLANTAAVGASAVYAPVKTLYATLTLTSAEFNTLEGNPSEVQLFSPVGTGAVTGHSPQLSYEIVSLTNSGTAQVRFSKFAMYCSCDLAQRPV